MAAATNSSSAAAVLAAAIARESLVFMGSAEEGGRKQIIGRMRQQLHGRLVVAPPTWNVDALDELVGNYSFFLNLHKSGGEGTTSPLEVFRLSGM